jgi:hypothetical protein
LFILHECENKNIEYKNNYFLILKKSNFYELSPPSRGQQSSMAPFPEDWESLSEVKESVRKELSAAHFVCGLSPSFGPKLQLKLALLAQT